MGGVGDRQPPAHQPFLDALPYHFFKQSPKYLPEGRLAPPQLRDGAVIRHPVKQIQPQVPPQGYVSLDPLLDLPLRGNHI